MKFWVRRRISVKASWNKIARHYQRKTRISTEDFHYGALAPGESKLRLLGDVKGKEVLELGCGGGQNTIALSKLGAFAEGIDISPEQINFARELARTEKVAARFHVGSIDHLGIFSDESKDLVVSSFALSYVERLDNVFSEVYRILEKGGAFLFADAHPLASRGRSVRVGAKSLWALDQYFKRGAMVWTWPRFENGTTASFRSYHRTIQDYYDALTKAGFTVERIVEPEPVRMKGTKPVEETPCYAPAVAKEYLIWRNVPYTIIFKARKPG